MRVLFSKGLVFISKPRCGSTSIRIRMGQYISKKDRDFSVDEAEESTVFHPHDMAPYVKAKLAEFYPDHPNLTYFVTTRNPVDMLWSYYRFFRPDTECRYNYAPEWNESSAMGFEDWIQHGRVGIRDGRREFVPSWVSTENLSPLCLEAYIIDRAGNNHVDQVFRLENTEKLNRWLSRQLENRSFPALSEAIQTRSLKAFFHARKKNLRLLPHVNQSEKAEETEKDKKPLVLSESSLHAIRMMFPMESKMYNI